MVHPATTALPRCHLYHRMTRTARATLALAHPRQDKRGGEGRERDSSNHWQPPRRGRDGRDRLAPPLLILLPHADTHTHTRAHGTLVAWGTNIRRTDACKNLHATVRQRRGIQVPSCHCHHARARDQKRLRTAKSPQCSGERNNQAASSSEVRTTTTTAVPLIKRHADDDDRIRNSISS